MRNLKLAAALMLVFIVPAQADEKPTQFWNLTEWTIVDFKLAPAGTGKFGPNQCLNDKDASVDADERLKITSVPTGQYDARIGFKNGRVCKAKNLSIVEGEIFDVGETDLVDCSK